MQIKIASERGSLHQAYRFPAARNKEQCAASMTLWFQAIRLFALCVCAAAAAVCAIGTCALRFFKAKTHFNTLVVAGLHSRYYCMCAPGKVEFKREIASGKRARAATLFRSFRSTAMAENAAGCLLQSACQRHTLVQSKSMHAGTANLVRRFSHS